MRRIRRSTKALRARRVSNTQSLTVTEQVQAELPTENEVNTAEATVANWIERGKDIRDRATPAIDARNSAIMDAWDISKAAEKRIW